MVSLSKTSENFSIRNEIHTIDQERNIIQQELDTMESILPSPIDQNFTRKSKGSNNKMRETLYRLARPFDQQFSLNIRFNHQLIDRNLFNTTNEEDIEERFQDLYRITKNVLQFFVLEPEILDKTNRDLLTKAENLLPTLIETHPQSLDQRIENYNYCLQIIEYFQPNIRYYVQRTDLIDTIY